MSAVAGLPLVRRGAFVGAAICALVLLAVFYSIVSGGVQRAALRRSEAMSEAVALRWVPRPTRAARAAYFPSRRVSIARAGD